MKIFTSWADAILRDDGNSGADSGGQSAGAASGSDAGASGAAASAEGASGNAAAADPGAAAASAAASGTSPYKPEGIPDHLLGANDQETIDRLFKSVNGFRKDMGDVPETAEGYRNFGEVDEAIKPFMDTLTGDPIFDRVAQVAKAEGIPLSKFQNLTRAMITAGAELGMYEPPINVEAERAALTPDTARHLPEAEQKAARLRRMNDNYAWLDTQVAKDGQSGLSKEAVDFAKSMLGDRAIGHQFIEHFRAQTAGGKGPLLNTPPTGAADPKAEISRRQALPENTWGNPKFNQASYDQLQKDARAVYGD